MMANHPEKSPILLRLLPSIPVFGREFMRASVFYCYVLLMTGVSDPMPGQDRPSPTSLKGLKGVFPQVYADRGLQQAMEMRTEQELRQAGIKVLSEKDCELVPDTALLHRDVIIRCERDEVSCGYFVGLKLGQHVQLTRGQRAHRYSDHLEQPLYR